MPFKLRQMKQSVFRQYFAIKLLALIFKIVIAKMENRILILFLATFLVPFVVSNERSLNRTNLECSGRPHYNVTMAAYFPDFQSNDESDYLDAKMKKLRPLQDFLDDRTDFVTVSMDLDSGIPYGTKLCIPELNTKFQRQVLLQARDRSNYGDVKKNSPDFSHVDICVRSEEDSYDNAVNGIVTLYSL